MPRSKNDADEYTQLGIRVESYNVRSDVSINVNLRAAPLRSAEDEPVIRCVTYIEIVGTSNYPEHRANERYELSVHGDASGRMRLQLKDIQKVDESGVRQWRKYRGVSMPVYDSPPGLTVLERRRGTRQWRMWMPIAPDLVSDMLLLLQSQRQLYVSIYERKADRRHWVQDFSLQTTDPSLE
jgi:hypothetical protein